MVDTSANEQRLNIFTDGNQQDLHFSALAGGGYVAVWQSTLQNGSGTGLTAQIYNDFGERVGLPFFIEQETVGNQTIGGVSGTADGGFVVTWQGNDFREVMARQFDASGEPVADEFMVNAETYSTQNQPEVTGLTGGGYVVTWSSVNDETFTTDVRAQRYDANGVAQGGEFSVNTTTAGTQSQSEVAALNDGGFVVVWVDTNAADGAAAGVFSQRYNATGVAQGSETLVNTSTSGSQNNPDVVALDGGGYVVVWSDDSGLDGSSGGIFAQVYDASGGSVGSEFLVNQFTASFQYQPAVAATSDGGFFVAWNSYTTINGTTYDIVGRHFDASGTALTDDIVISQDGNAFTPERPDVIGLANGGIVVGWDYPAANGDGDGRAVYQRFLELDGSDIGSPTSPILEAFDRNITFSEDDLQSGPQILDASGAVSVSGPADFDGGRLSVTRITSLSDEVQFNQADGRDDDVLGLRDQGTAAGEIGVAGTTVTFGGVAIGTITSDGTNGENLEITFNANADRDAVEALAENITYQNPSDDPIETVELALLLEDGDGGASEPVRVTVTVIPEIDAPQPVFGSDVVVNTFGTSTQHQPVVTELADGGWVVMWESFSQDTLSSNTYGIIGQRYDSSGALVGPEFLVNSQVQGSQQQVDVTSINGGASAGGFIAVWYDSNNSTEGNVRAQIFDANSQPVGDEISVPSTIFSTQDQPSITTFGDGSFAVAWRSYEQATNTYDIKVQLFDDTGAQVGGEIIANTFTPSTQENPTIIALAGGGFAVSWMSFDQGGTDTYDISSRVFDADGLPVSAEVTVNAATDGQQYLPSSASLEDGTYVVVWEDHSGRDGNSYGVYGQIMSATGTPIDGQFLVNEETQGVQGEPVVTALPGGGFAVAYYTTATVFDGSSNNIVIQHYDADGSRIDGEVQVNTASSSAQYQPAIATLSNGDTVIVYRDDGGRDGSGPGVLMQVVGDPANYAGAANNPVVSIAQGTVVFGEDDVNAAPQILFAGVDVGDADSADFDGGVLNVFRGGAAQLDTLFQAPDDETQDSFGIRDDGNGAGQIGVSGNSVTFGGTVIGTITSDGSNGASLTISLNSNATPVTVEALLENVTFSNGSDDPISSREIRVVLTDGDGGTSQPIDVTVQITEDFEGVTPISPEIQVNSFENSAQDAPDVSALDSGGYIAVWRSYDQDAGVNDYGIFGQRFDSTGQPVGDEFQINTQEVGSQLDPQVAGIAAADGGGYVVTWYDQSNTTGRIKAQVYNDDGSVRTAEFVVETEVYSTQDTPAIAAVPGGFLVSWSSFNDETFTWDIRGQFYDGTGATQGSEFTVNTTTTDGTQYNSEIAVDASGNIVVVWEDQSSQDGSGYGVYGQRIDNTGTLVGDEFAINTTTPSNQYLAQVDFLTDGRFVVAWYDDSGLDGSGGGVFAQIFAADATPIGTQFLVNSEISSTQQVRDVVGLSDGGFAIAFDDASGADGSGWGVFVQQYNADGSRRDGAVQVNDEFSSTQSEIQITEITDGVNTGIAAVWTSTASATAGDGNNNGVFTRILGTEGTLQPTNVMPEVENLDRTVDYDVATIGSAQLIDNSITLSDVDSANFDGGSVELKFIDFRVTADDQLSILDGKGITVSGANVSFDGTLIGTVDGTDNGVNGADLVINLNANATPDNVRFLMEQLAFASATPVVGSDREVSLRVTDGDGAISEGDSIRIEISSSVSAVTISLSDVVSLDATETEVEAGVRLNPSVDFDYGLANGFDGGTVEMGYRTAITSRFGTEFETLTVANDGTGTNQIGINGTDITFEGVVIGTIDPVLNGEDGANLLINLVAAATPAGIDALIEAFVYQNNSDGPNTFTNFDIRVTDANGSTTGDRDFQINVTPEVDGATVALGGEMQVNAFTTGEQINPAVTELADGGFVVTWQSFNQDSSSGSNYGVYQQRYTAEGEPVGPELLVNETTTGAQDTPDVAGLTGGGWVTVWEGNDASGVGINARIYDANGVPGAEFLVNQQESSTQDYPSVAALSNGNFVVTWDAQTSAGSGDGSAQGIAARVFDATGTPVSASDIVVNTFTSSTQRYSDVTGLDGGGFVTVWESNQVDGDGYGIAFQRFDNAGVPVGTETIVNTTTAGSQDTPEIASLTDGGFVVVWQSPDGSGDGVYMQRFDAAGVAVGGEVQVNDFQSSTQTVRDVVGTTDGGWVVVWNDPNSLDGSGNSVQAQRYDSAGNRIDGSFVVNEESSSTQVDGALATLSDGRVVVAYESNTSAGAGDGNGNGVFVRLFGDAAQAQSADPVLGGIADRTLNESDLNAGSTQVFSTGAISVADLDSTDFDGGRLMVHVVRDYAAAEQFAAPDNLLQDVMTFSGSAISITGSSVAVDGVTIGTLEEDGQSGSGLQVLLNANATAELVETLLRGLAYANPSDDPRSTREIEVTLSDGDGGVSDHQTFTITITPEIDGFEAVGTEAQVNSFTDGQQYNSDVAGLSGGGHVVVWASYNQDASGSNNYGVFAQRYDVDGQPVGPEFQANSTFAGSQNNPAVVGLSDGSFVVAWDGFGQDDSTGAYGQRFASDGTPIATEFRINDTTGGSDSSIDLTAATDGGFMAVWYSSTGSEIQGRIFDAAGVAAGPEFTININATGSQNDPAVTALAGGGYAVAWYDSDETNIVTRIVDASGTFVTGEIIANTNQDGTQNDPDIASLTGGGYVVTWTDANGLDGSSNGVYAQIYSEAGIAQGSQFLVNETVSNAQYESEVVGTPNGGFVVVYRDNSGIDGSGGGIVAQQFDANGNRIDGQIVVNTEFSSTQDDPSIDVLANGSVIVTWTSNTSVTAGDGSGQGIFSQILGDPADFDLEGRPVLQGINDTVVFLENTLNIGPQLIDANNAVALSDIDSADFDGGFVRVDNVIVSRGFQDQVSAPDNFTQDNVGLRQDQGITISSNAVFVDGIQVGSITESGVAGEPFEISLNRNASVDIVELLLENLTYRNTSDDPEADRVLRIQVGDGDGGVSDPSLVTVSITPEVDGAAPVFGERQANTETEGEQSNSDVAQLDDGGFVIVWQSVGQDLVGTYGVYGQRFDANGNAVDAEFQVNSNIVGSQYQPSVSSLDTGGWVVTWRDDSGLDGSGNGVFSQRYNADGTTAGSEEQVNTFFNSTQYESAVTVLENGDYVVTWNSFGSNEPGGNSFDIHAQVFEADGTAIGDQFRVNSEVASTQDQPQVTSLANGGFAISWTSTTSGTAGDGSGQGVFYQVYADDTADYAAVGGELQANSYTDSTQNTSSIVGLTGGGHVIVWQSNGQDGSSTGVFAQQYDAAGVPVGQEFRVNDQRINSQSEADVAALSTGGYVIVFTDNSSTDGSGVGVFVQQYAANGNRIDDAIQVNTEFSSTQNDPHVAALDNGGFVVSWTSNTSATAGDGSSTGVFYQVFSNSAPVVTDVSATTPEDNALVLDSAIFVEGFADAENQALAEIRIDVLPSTGTLEFNNSPIAPGQIVTVAELDAGALVYFPPQDFNGTADFGWTGSDGSSFAQTIALTNITVTPVNDAVGLQSIPDQTISEGSFLGVVAQLTDPDNDTYAITVNYGEGDADVTFNTASNSPNLSNFYEAEGTYTVTLDVDDQNGSIESVSFTVNVENGAPFAGNDTYFTDEDTAVSGVNLFADDNDPGGDPYGITAINGVAYTAGTTVLTASGASVTVSASGELVYDSSASATLQALADGQSANDSFTYTITDDGGLSDTATVTVVVAGADDNVIAQDDAFTVDEDSQLTANVFDDNGNGVDFDPEGDGLTITSINGNAGLVGAPFAVSGGGILQLNDDGTISFDAAGAYDELNVGDTRDITFDYVVEEDGSNLTASAQGTITITGVNDDPTAQNDGQSTQLNTAVNFDPRGNDFDVDAGDTFTITSVGAAANGEAVLELDGTITYTPDDGYSGADTFTYEITDENGGTSSATVSVTVQGSDAPVALNDLVSTDEDTALTNGNVFADNGNGADFDPEGEDFSVTAVNGVDASVGTQITLGSGALLTLNSDGTFEYDPNGSFEFLAASGATTDSFTYTITDENGGTDVATVTVNIDGLNDAPIMIDAAINAAEDGAPVNLNLAALGDDVDSDDTGSTLSYSITTDPSEGSASIVGTQLNFDPDTDFQDLNDGETREITVGVTATDGNGATSNESTVTISVLGVNDDPTLAAGALAAAEDGSAVTLDLAGLGDDVDNEDDGASLSYAITSDPSEGSATITGTTLTFEPGADFQDLNEGETREVIVTVQATDARGAVSGETDMTVTVTGVNDAPVITNADVDFTVAENTASVATITSEDADFGDLPTYSIEGGLDQALFQIDAATGALSFVTPPDFETPADAGGDNVYDVTVGVSDGLETVTQDVTVTVTDEDEDAAATVSIGVAPTSGDEGDSGTSEVVYTITRSGATTSAVVVSLALAGTALAGTDYTGTVPSTVTLGVGETTASFTLDIIGDVVAELDEDITVSISSVDRTDHAIGVTEATHTIINDDNSLPTAADDGPYDIDEDAGGTTGNVLDNDFDTDADDLISIDSADAVTDLGATVIDNGDGTFSVVGGAPYDALNAGETATDSFDYVISDGQGGQASATVLLAVTGRNDAPTLGAGLLDATEDGGAVSLDLSTLGDDADNEDDGATLSYSIIAAPGTGTASISGTELIFDPGTAFQTLAEGETQDVTVQITATDAQGAVSNTADVVITVTGVDDIPDFQSAASFSIDENQTDVGTVAATDVDSAGPMTYSISGGADASLFSIDAATGALSFDVAPDYEAPQDDGADNVYDVIVQADGGSGSLAEQSVSVTVNNVDEGGGLNDVIGTEGIDFLVGTDGDDRIDALGGAIDMIRGGGGNDVFVFTSSYDNGARERKLVSDFTVGEDLLDIGSATILSTQSVGTTTFINLDGDMDQIVLYGVSSFDTDYLL